MADFTKRRGDTWIFDLPLTRPNAQRVIVEGSPNNGTWTATYTSEDGRIATTAPIAHNANAAAVQAAFEGLPNVSVGDLTVSGGPGPGTAWLVTINTDGAYGIAVTNVSLSGGSNVSIRAENEPFDLSGATLYATFKQNINAADDDDGVFQFSWIDGGASDGITVADAASGEAVLTIPDSDSSTFTVARYQYDVQVTDASGETFTPDTGTLTVLADVTRTVV